MLIDVGHGMKSAIERHRELHNHRGNLAYRWARVLISGSAKLRFAREPDREVQWETPPVEAQPSGLIRGDDGRAEADDGRRLSPFQRRYRRVARRQRLGLHEALLLGRRRTVVAGRVGLAIELPVSEAQHTCDRDREVRALHRHA